MRFLGSWLGLLGTVALAGLSADAGAQPVGSEFQINTYTTSNQRTYPYGARFVAADASGNFVVAWSGSGPGDASGVFGQRYDSAGVPLGSEFRVNAFTTAGQGSPSVVAAADGDFVVVWHGRGQGDSFGVFGRRFDSAGDALGSQFRVNSYTTNDQGDPSAAAAADGSFVVVWTGSGQSDVEGVFGQRYDTEGVAKGGEFRVNSYTTFTQRSPSVASDADGNFVVVWYSVPHRNIFGQRFDNEGVAQGDEFEVGKPQGPFVPLFPSVAADAGGNFVVVWELYNSGYYGPRSYGIFGQRYDNEGVAQGDEFLVNSYTSGDPADPSVAADASGNFVVVWRSSGQDDDSGGVFGQRYDSAGIAQAGEFQINLFTTASQDSASVVATGINQFVVAWTSDDQDGDGEGVFGRRFDFGGETITVVRPNTNVKWLIGSIREIRWTHNLGIDATFRIKLDRNDDGDYEELIAAAAPAKGPTKGHFAWTVTGPPSATARVRVTWTDDPSVSDTSDVTFQIRPVPLDSGR